MGEPGLGHWASAGGLLPPGPAGGRDLRSSCSASRAQSVLTRLCRRKSPCDPSEGAGVRGGGLPGGCWGPAAWLRPYWLNRSSAVLDSAFT